jgi:MSHA pilin protein MshA
MNKNFKAGSQGGFTLIELIVVIVILGILAATALPKFANLNGDARLSSIQAARGALSATSAMVHGKYLINPANAATGAKLNVEGTDVTYKNGYPQADAGLITAAGLDDYKLVSNSAGVMVLAPQGVASDTNCRVTYTEASSPTSPPSIAVTADSAGCQ